ncbi:hypothetical protein EAJ15_12110 [Parabacteroides merdae]|nr:hypothetical protein EAJ15_12110 [Parabacteroides merdae]
MYFQFCFHISVFFKLIKLHSTELFEMMQATDKQTVQRSNKDSEKRETSQFAEVRPISLFFCLLPTNKKGNG